MSEAEAWDAPDAHVITRWLGRDAPDEPYEVTTLQPREPGRVLLCSDGMWQYASATTDVQELVQLLSSSITPIELARDLVNAACALGGTDNVTVAIIDVDPGSPRSEEDQ